MKTLFDLLYPEPDSRPWRTRALRVLFVVAAVVVWVVGGLARQHATDPSIPSDPVDAFRYVLPRLVQALAVVGVFAAGAALLRWFKRRNHA